MKVRYTLLFSPLGFLLQFLFIISVGCLEKPTRLFLLSPYEPWLGFGEILDRNFTDAGGHAFAGGAILGFLAGVLVYSLLIGTLFGFIYEKLIRPRMSFNDLK